MGLDNRYLIFLPLNIRYVVGFLIWHRYALTKVKISRLELGTVGYVVLWLSMVFFMLIKLFFWLILIDEMRISVFGKHGVMILKLLGVFERIFFNGWNVIRPADEALFLPLVIEFWGRYDLIDS